MKKKASFLSIVVPLVIMFASVAQADATDDHWVVRLGAHVVAPASDNGRLAGMRATIGHNVRPTVSVEYLLTTSMGFEVLAAVPFRHDIRLNGMQAATARQLPPVIGMNYHFMTNQAVSPFVGIGVNFTRFLSARGEGLLQGSHVDLDNSWGPAIHAGVDFRLSSSWIVTADMRWIDIRSTVHVNGVNVGKAKVDPFVYGLSIGYRF